MCGNCLTTNNRIQLPIEGVLLRTPSILYEKLVLQNPSAFEYNKDKQNNCGTAGKVKPNLQSEVAKGYNNNR